MISYTADRFSFEDRSLIATTRLIVRALPDLDFGPQGPSDEGDPELRIGVNCHMLCRALARFLPVRVEDGLFAFSWRHSWLRTGSENIIDACPVETDGEPTLVLSKDRLSIGQRLYERREIELVRNPCPETLHRFDDRVEQVVRAVAETIAQCGVIVQEDKGLTRLVADRRPPLKKELPRTRRPAP